MQLDIRRVFVFVAAALPAGEQNPPLTPNEACHKLIFAFLVPVHVLCLPSFGCARMRTKLARNGHVLGVLASLFAPLAWMMTTLSLAALTPALLLFGSDVRNRSLCLGRRSRASFCELQQLRRFGG